MNKENKEMKRNNHNNKIKAKFENQPFHCRNREIQNT